MVTNAQPSTPAFGVANGTLCTVVDVLLRPGAVVQLEPLSNTNQATLIHTVLADEVEGLVLRHANPELAARATRHFPSLPAGCFPLSRQRISVTFLYNGVRTTVGMSQIPIVQAFATTGHSTQGSTLPRCTVYEWNPTLAGYDYTVLSRVGTSRHLDVLAPIPEDVRWPVPYEAMHEMNRLRALVGLPQQHVPDPPSARGRRGGSRCLFALNGLTHLHALAYKCR